MLKTFFLKTRFLVLSKITNQSVHILHLLQTQAKNVSYVINKMFIYLDLEQNLEIGVQMCSSRKNSLIKVVFC